MSVRLAATISLILVLVWPTALVQAVPVCRFALRGDGMSLTVALLGSPNMGLEIDWGDGVTSAVNTRLSPGRGRAFLTHDYASPGTYRLTIRAMTPGGDGCQYEFEPEIPYDGGDDDDNRAILPPRGAPYSSDQLADVELGDALAEVGPDRAPADLPDTGGPTLVSQVAESAVAAVESVGAAVRDFVGFLFGR